MSGQVRERETLLDPRALATRILRVVGPGASVKGLIFALVLRHAWQPRHCLQLRERGRLRWCLQPRRRMCNHQEKRTYCACSWGRRRSSKNFLLEL